jgi:hypothetical protein
MSAGGAGQPLLSAVYIIDEFWNLERLPWRESVHSALRFVDELIVVHGGKRNAEGRQPAWEYLQGLNDPRVQLHHFPWPEDFDWRQIGRSCAYGQLQARGQWCMRVLADEVFADDFPRIREVLASAKPSLRTVHVDRLYLLGYEFAHPYHIQLIFRNDKTLGFGTVNPAQGGKAMPGLFDGPIESDLWYDGKEVVSIREDAILRDPRGAERLLAGETPRGYRPPVLRGHTHVKLGLFNVDVNYFTDDEVIRQKETSHAGYDRLPQEYFFRVFPKGKAILETLANKQRTMAEGRRLRRVTLPAALMDFHRRHCDVENPTTRTCRAYGLPWDERDPKMSAFRRWLKMTEGRLRRLVRSRAAIP